MYISDITLKYWKKEHACLLFSKVCPPMPALVLSCSFIIFWIFCPFCSFIRFSIKRHMEMPNCEQDLLLNGKGYISSQIMQSANSEPKLSLIVLLFNVWFKKIGSKHNSNTLLSLLWIFMKHLCGMYGLAMILSISR